MRTFLILAFVFAAVHCTQKFELNLDMFQKMQHHYGNPAFGCLHDEVAAGLQGASGDDCMPRAYNNACPSDVPTGTTATPMALVQDQSGNKYCCLVCRGLASGTCPSTASCVSPRGLNIPGMDLQAMVGICLYPAPSKMLQDN